MRKPNERKIIQLTFKRQGDKFVSQSLTECPVLILSLIHISEPTRPY